MMCSVVYNGRCCFTMLFYHFFYCMLLFPFLGMCVCVFLCRHPFDVVKKVMQVREFFIHTHIVQEPSAKHASAMRTLVAMCMTEGWRSLFKGLVPSLAKAGPNSAIVFVTYEATQKILYKISPKKPEPLTD